MKVLLDTNILIHREAATVIQPDIGKIFLWLDKLQAEKWVHPASIDELRKHGDPRVRQTFERKLESYRVMQSSSPLADAVRAAAVADKTENDKNDTLLLNEVYVGRVDLLVTEDRGVHAKALKVGMGDRVFTIDSYLEKVVAENPGLTDYRVPTVSKVLFGHIDVRQSFFDGFRQDYGEIEFDKWFRRKADDEAYVSSADGNLVAFLYLKLEDVSEDYRDIQPAFLPGRRLKIGTLKVELNGYKLGERFLKIVFDNALRLRVDEIYVTIFPRTMGQMRLVKLLEDFGFYHHGEKKGPTGSESVYVRDMRPSFDPENPKLTFPFVSSQQRAFIVPIYPDYHTSLLPDSILNNETPADFIEQEPHRNAIQKVYVSRSLFRGLQRADSIVFYRTGGKYKSVVTTLGIVDGVYRNIRDENQFINFCRKRSVFSDDDLRTQWNRIPRDRPFVVGFLYAYSFPRRPNLAELIENGVIRSVDKAPRGFEQLHPEQFAKILELANADTRVIVH